MTKNLRAFFLIIIFQLLANYSGVGTAAPIYNKKNTPGYTSNNYHPSWRNLRKHFSLHDVSKYPDVKKQIDWLRNNPEYLRDFAKYSQPYIYYILKTITENNIPGEIALLPMVESVFNPFAYSGAGAAGLWQIMPGTATGYGLEQNWWYDDRRDLVAATDAAITYLKYLHKFFNGDWLLALAAYNSGEGKVRQAVEQNKKLGLQTDFWSLSLPSQTRDYVPRLLALVAIIANPSKYNIELPPYNLEPYFYIIETNSQVDLIKIAKIAKLDINEIYLLNSGFNRWVSQPHAHQKILIPIDKVALILKNLKSYSSKSLLHEYVIKHGDTLSSISAKFSSPVKIIKEINNLKSAHLREGKKIVVPGNIDKKHKTKLLKDSINKKTNNNGPRKIVYKIRVNDTLSSIAKRFQVTKSALEFWNKLSPSKRLPIGKVLTLWIPRKYKRTHTITNGDNLSYIAQKYNTSVKELIKLNPSLPKQKYLRLGSRIILPLQ